MAKIVAEIKEINRALQELRVKLGGHATTSELRDLRGTVSLLLGRYDTMKNSVASDQHRLDSLSIHIESIVENIKKIRVNTDRHGQEILTITSKQLARGKTRYESDVQVLRAHQQLLHDYA